jgi:biotin transport system substrate-specific component
MTTAQPTLIATVWPKTDQTSLARTVLLAVFGTLLLTASAKLQIPFWPVPLTMQTFVVLTLGMVYGWRLGAATVALYLVEGAVGLPVFAGTPERGIGLAYMAGPTGGYLVGFVLAAALTGWLAEKGWDRSPVRTAAAMFLGNIALYLPGIAWLSGIIGFDKAVQVGLVPFLLGDALKLVLAVVALPAAWKLVQKVRG